MKWTSSRSRPTWQAHLGILLSASLFVLPIVAYVWTAQVRHAENPQDKVVPTLSKRWAKASYRTALEEDRKGDYRLLVDTWASGKRFG